MVCLIIAVVVVPDMYFALTGVGVALVVMLLARLPVSFIVKRLLVVVPFVFTLCLLILFTHEGGGEIARFGFLSIQAEGLERSVLIAARAMAAVILVLCMLGTMKFENTLKALEHLKIPTKLTQLIMFTYRYIFVLIDEFLGMSRSLASRGFQKGTNLRTVNTLAKMVGMLFIRSYERADRVCNTMVSRGYDGRLQTITEFRMQKKDITKAAVLVAAGLALNLCCLIGF